MRAFYREDEARKQKIGAATRGKRHHNWQGGKTYGSNHGYRGPGWAAIAAKVRKRANGRCEECGAAQRDARALDVHHRIPFFNFTVSAEANRPSNLVALCKPCHMAAEWRANERQAVMTFMAGPTGRRKRVAA